MAFIVNADNDPVLRRGERLARFGSMIPLLGVCAVNIAGLIVRAVAGRQVVPWGTCVLFILACVVLGQAMVWVGMDNLRRCAGWDSGIVGYLWSGGIATTLAVCYTWVFPPAVIPWIAPVVASVARRRLVRRGRAVGA